MNAGVRASVEELVEHDCCRRHCKIMLLKVGSACSSNAADVVIVLILNRRAKDTNAFR